MSGPPVKMQVEGLSFFYGRHRAVEDVSFPIHEHRITALIGPSGCGKSTLLRCFNRMHDLYPGNRYEGVVRMLPDGFNVVEPEVDAQSVRLRIGMVFQKPNPFPKSIFDNVAYGLRIRGERDSNALHRRVVAALKDAALWEETQDRLRASALELSGGQQQRLCIARTLAPEPEVVLFDEPTSALDPIATQKIEDLVTHLKGRTTVVIVTHNMQQARRISDYVAYMYLGRLIEFGDTQTMFESPREPMTRDYLGGRFG